MTTIPTFAPSPAASSSAQYAVTSTTTCARWQTEAARHETAADAWRYAALDLLETDAGLDADDVALDVEVLLTMTEPSTFLGASGVDWTVAVVADDLDPDELVTVEPRDAADLEPAAVSPR